MVDERPAGYDDLYAYIDSQFLDGLEGEEGEKPALKPAASSGRRDLPLRARTPLGPVSLPPMGPTRSGLRTPPPPVPPDPNHDTAQAAPASPAVQPTAMPISRVAKLLAEAAATPAPVEDVVEVQIPDEPEHNTPPFIDPREIIRPRKSAPGGGFQMRIPKLEDYLPTLKDDSRPAPRKAVVRMAAPSQRETAPPRAPKPPRRLKRPELSGPRPRRRRSPDQAPFDIAALPESLRGIAVTGSSAVLSKYYHRPKSETLEQTVTRLTNPELTLEETAKLLGVCPATVRRYTNKGWLRHHRTSGNQRRFRLSDITDFLKEFARKQRA